MTVWSPGQYVKFEDERSRPAAELLQRVPVERPRRVVDIGCGPGNSTELVLARYPEAQVIGLDSSAEMLVAARKRLPAVAFVEADVATWMPDPVAEVFFSNATFQWVPEHKVVLRRLIEALPRGGALAVQVPDNTAEPTHRLMREVAEDGPWSAKFAAPMAREPIGSPAEYYDLLKPFSADVDIWHTVYNHPMADAAAIVEWVKGTGLRPYLARLDRDEQGTWLAEYEKRVAAAYPPLVDGRVLLRFPRLFMVAVRN